MPGEGARAGRGREQGGLRAHGDHSPNLPWLPWTTGLTCFCAAMRFWSLFLQAGSCRCWKVSYPVVIPEGRRTWEKSRASLKLLGNSCTCCWSTGLPSLDPRLGGHSERQVKRCKKWQFQARRVQRPPYLETSSFDTSIELIVLPSPAPEAVGHPIALEREQHHSSQGPAQLHGLRGADTSPVSSVQPPAAQTTGSVPKPF